MKRSFLILIFVAGLFNLALSEEPARDFLDGLRARGYHDVAMDYLTQMQTSKLAPTELRTNLLYEKSQLLVDSSRSQRDSAVREEQLNQAQKWLEEFIQTQSTSDKINSARNQIGSLIVERARMKFEQSKENNDPQLMKASRELYEQSFKVFADLQASVNAQLQEIPKVLNSRDREEAKLIERRTQLRADYLQTELFAAAIREELADALPTGSADQTKYIVEAAQMYDGIYKDYRTRLAGRYARMYQGRCFFRLGNTKEALGYFGELLDQPNEPEALMLLKAKTLAMAMEAWLAPSEKKYFEAIKRATAWFEETPPSKERETEWVAIRFHLARALKMQADEASRMQPPDRALASKSISAATDALRFVAGETGELQDDARSLLAELGENPDQQKDLEPDSFVSAQAVAKEALDSIAPLSEKVTSLSSQILSENDAANKSALEAQLAATREEISEATQNAIRYYRLAIELADSKTPQSNVNLARYFLCYVYFLKEDYFDAAIVGEFVARRYPTSPGAKQCAKIVMASYLKLADQNANPEFEIERLQSLGDYVTSTWRDEPETQQTLATLIPFLINVGQPTRAARFVKVFPTEFPNRIDFELLIGQSIWGQFRTLQQQLSSSIAGEISDTEARKETEHQLVVLKDEAKELLAAAYRRLPEDQVVDQASATAMLSLAQIHVEDQEFESAIEVLQHPTLGPLSLVKENHDAASNPLFIEESYRTALRSYVASLGSGDPTVMQNTKSMISAMQQFLGNDAEGKTRMLGVYVNLAQDVERQMQSAPPEAKLEMSGVFESFLTELSSGSEDVAVLNWVADTFATLAAGFQQDGELNENAKRYYEQSDNAFQSLLRQPNLTPTQVIQFKAQLAGVRFQMGQFDSALQLYQEVLQQEPNSINVQVAAARLLQAWGKQDSHRYRQAVNGIENADQKPTVWGWAKIALAAIQHPQFRETFYESRYEMANCHFAEASQTSGEAKANLLRQAEQNLSKTAKLYPSMGEWTSKYDALLRQVQTALGQPASGLSVELNKHTTSQ